jgi:hypothetical protein
MPIVALITRGDRASDSRAHMHALRMHRRDPPGYHHRRRHRTARAGDAARTIPRRFQLRLQRTWRAKLPEQTRAPSRTNWGKPGASRRERRCERRWRFVGGMGVHACVSVCGYCHVWRFAKSARFHAGRSFRGAIRRRFMLDASARQKLSAIG